MMYGTPKVRVKSIFWGVSLWLIYSDPYKLMVVRAYQKGYLEYDMLAKKYGITRSSPFKRQKKGAFFLRAMYGYPIFPAGTA